MAPIKAPLAQSESKARFFERLELSEENEVHRRLYAMMKEEAVEGRKRMTASPDSLAPQYRDDPRVEPPYSNAQISETAIHREIMRIYHTARRETREIYDLGHDNERVEEENWIIRWMLWHVFRYRDNRNRHRRQISPDSDEAATEMATHGGSIRGASTSTSPTASNASTSLPSSSSINQTPTRYWDPVREN